MNTRTELRDPFDDIEKPHPVVRDSFGNTTPLTVRLGELWTDFLRVADGRMDPDAPKRSTSAAPLLDDVKGVLQWD